jgi:hypothetical protein
VSQEEVKEQTKKIIGRGRKILRYGVNIFVYFFVSIFMLFMIFVGVSQTQLFKNWLRNKIVEIVNNEIHGKLSIEKLDGTIFTSLKITNAALVSTQNDTVVQIKNLEVKTSPLKLLFKNIYVRKFDLSGARIKLVQENDGKLNLLKIFPSSETKDTTTSEFPFSFEVAEFQMNHIDFSLQKYDKVGSDQYYPTMNMEDLRINDLNVAFNAFADLNKYEYRLDINNISFNPNFQFFNLKHLSGTIVLTPNVAGISNLHFQTDRSDFELNAGISDIDFLKNFSMKKLEEAPLRLSLIGDKINFEEITTYVPQMDILSGTIAARLEAVGTFNDLKVKTLSVEFNKTSLEATANLKHLLEPDKMFIDVSFKNSILDPGDPNLLLKSLSLPDLKDLGVINIDTLSYSGNPRNFKTKFAFKTDKGNINGNVNLNFLQPEMQYEAKLITQQLDLKSLMTIPTDLNSEIDISGKGTDPQNMTFKLSLLSKDSKIGDNYLSSMSLNSFASEGTFKSNFKIDSDSIYVNLNADVDFKNPKDPSYEVKGSVNKLNLGKLLQNKSLLSKINLDIDVSGQGFNPDSMDLFLVTDIKNSQIKEFNIDSTRLILDVRRNDNGKKIVNIVSDIADFTISGKYSITQLGTVISREAEIMDKMITSKLNPVLAMDTISVASQINSTELNYKSLPNFNLDYLLDFKESLTLNLGKYDLQIDGQMDGNMKSVDDSLSLLLNSYFNYLKFWSTEQVYFVVNTKLGLTLHNHLINGFQENTDADISFSSERLYAGMNFYNVKSKISFDGEKLIIDSYGEYEDKLDAKLNAVANFNKHSLDVKFDTLRLSYNQFKIFNPKNLFLSFSQGTVNFRDFNLNAGDGTILIDGSFGESGDNNVNIIIDKISGENIVKDLLELDGEQGIKTSINLTGSLRGNFSNPKFSLNANTTDIIYAKHSFGSLKSKFDYADNSLKTDIRFVDSLNNFNSPKVLVTGFIPLELSANLDSVTKANQKLDLTIQSFDFDLSSLSEIFPYVEFKKGKLETDIYVSGKVSKPQAVGYFSIKDTRFKVTYNNLDYDLNTKIWIDDEEVTIESIELKNVFGTKYGGTIKGDGILKFKNFRPDSTNIKLSGDLKILDNISKSANQFAYGDLAIQTRGDIVYSSYKDKSYLTLPIDVTVAELTVPLEKSAYASSSGFIYKYHDYSTKNSKLISELDSLIQLTNNKTNNNENSNGTSKFDYTIDIKLDTEAEIVVVLSKELDQNLDLILGGNFFLESMSGKTKTGGALKLLDGSKISFIKTFEATGNISFEKLSNPIVDIVGTYKGYYTPAADDKSSSSTASSEREVAVKIKLKGPLSELNKNFMKDENNVGVYIGKQNIEEDKKDPTKTASDAFFFIITGNFTTGASQQDKNAVASTATALAGSVLGGFLNQYLGDYVKSVQLRQVGTETKFSLIGKAGKFKYEIGGSTDIFQDLSRANISIEYPITLRLQLKLERKESENQLNSINNPLFNQLGLKYNFEF